MEDAFAGGCAGSCGGQDRCGPPLVFGTAALLSALEERSGFPWLIPSISGTCWGRSISTLTRNSSLPAWAKNARSWRWKKPLVGPPLVSGGVSGGAGGNMAISSWPVGGAGYFRWAISEERVRSRSLMELGDKGLRGLAETGECLRGEW